ncbi:hypothetical protein OQA88_10821 [Cercophora sp. LCS_1]
MVLASDHLKVAVTNCLEVVRGDSGIQRWQELEGKLLDFLTWATSAMGTHSRLTCDIMLTLSDVYDAWGDTKTADRLALTAYRNSHHADVTGQLGDNDGPYPEDKLNSKVLHEVLDSPWSNVAQLFEKRRIKRGQALAISQRMLTGVSTACCLECNSSFSNLGVIYGEDGEQSEEIWPQEIIKVSDTSLDDMDFLPGTGPVDSELFPAVALGMDETRLTEGAALRFARSPEWVITAWERGKIAPTPSILTAMMCHHRGRNPSSQLMALCAAVAFILAHGRHDSADWDIAMAEAMPIAKDLQRLRKGDSMSTKILDTAVGSDFMMSVAAHPHGAWILDVFMDAAGAERLPQVTEEITLAAIGNPLDRTGLVKSLYKMCSLANTRLPVTEEVIVAALEASNNDSQLIDALIGGPPPSVNEEMATVESTDFPSASPWRSRHVPREILTADRVVRTAVETGSTNFLRKTVSVQRGERIPVTHAIALKVASSKDGDIMMNFFQWNQYATHNISEEVAEAALANGWVPFLRTEEIEVSGFYGEDEVVPVSRRLERLLGRIHLDDDYFAAAGARLVDPFWDARSKRTIGDLSTLLEIKGDDALPATEAAVTTAIQFALQRVAEGFRMLRFSVDKYGNDLPVTERVVFAAADTDGMLTCKHEYGFCGKQQVFELLVNNLGSRLPVSSRVLEAVVRHGCGSVLKLLPKMTGDQLVVTEDVVRAAGRKGAGGKYSLWVWKLLLGSNATFELTEIVLVLALREVFSSAFGKTDSDTEEDFGGQLCGRWESLFQDIVRRYQRQSGSLTLPERLMMMAAQSEDIFKSLAGIKGAGQARLASEFLVGAHPAMILDRGTQIPEHAMAGAIDECNLRLSIWREERLLSSIYFLLKRYGSEWLDENSAIRDAILRMAWDAGPEQLTKMMGLMPSLREYIWDSDYPEGRKKRLDSWMRSMDHQATMALPLKTMMDAIQPVQQAIKLTKDTRLLAEALLFILSEHFMDYHKILTVEVIRIDRKEFFSLANNDERLAKMAALQVEIKDPQTLDSSPETRLHKTQEVLELLGEEGVGGAGTPLVYHDALQVAITNGDRARARVFAQRCYESRIVVAGEDDRRVFDEEAVVNQPPIHPLYGKGMKGKKTVKQIPKGLSEEDFERWL